MRVKMRLIVVAALASTASACAPSVIQKPIFPPRVDLDAVTEAKPVPPIEIVTDDEAAARYDADVESWGERVQSAGVRLCRWFNENGAEFDC